ncbi:hypothetical protein MTO96_036093 [Rhipicephalus appendiculatus]
MSSSRNGGARMCWRCSLNWRGVSGSSSYDTSGVSSGLARFRRSAFHHEALIHKRAKREVKKIRGANGPYGFHPLVVGDESGEEDEGGEPSPPEKTPSAPPQPPVIPVTPPTTTTTTTTATPRPSRKGDSGEEGEDEERRKKKGERKSPPVEDRAAVKRAAKGAVGNATVHVAAKNPRRTRLNDEGADGERRRSITARKKAQRNVPAKVHRLAPGGGAPKGKVFRPKTITGMGVTGFHELFIGDEGDEEDGEKEEQKPKPPKKSGSGGRRRGEESSEESGGGGGGGGISIGGGGGGKPTGTIPIPAAPIGRVPVGGGGGGGSGGGGGAGRPQGGGGAGSTPGGQKGYGRGFGRATGSEEDDDKEDNQDDNMF